MAKDDFSPFVRPAPGIPTADEELLQAENLYNEGRRLAQEFHVVDSTGKNIVQDVKMIEIDPAKKYFILVRIERPYPMSVIETIKEMLLHGLQRLGGSTDNVSLGVYFDMDIGIDERQAG